MFARACPRALRTKTLRSALHERPKCQSPFHNISISPLRRPSPRKTISFPKPPSQRHASTRAATIKLFKEYPFSMTLASASILFGMGMLVWVNLVYRRYIIGDFQAYPEPVAVKLRRALYYTNIDPQPKNALKYYRQALELAAEMGLDPLGEEMLGVRIQVAFFYEKIHQYQGAIDVLEVLRRDCLKWIEQSGEKAGDEGKRTRVLGKTVAISVKLAELYANQYVADQEAAEEKLVWAVTTLLKEQKRREDEGVKDGEGDWMSNEEIGGSLEALGHLYESKNQHYLAAPLFLQALGLCPPRSCHAVVLMNNLAVSLALQNPPPSFAPGQPPASSASNRADARRWAERSLALEASIRPPERTAECDEGCAVAKINLGDFAMMEGNLEEARRRAEDGRERSRVVGFQEGVERADELLEEVKKKM